MRNVLVIVILAGLLLSYTAARSEIKFDEFYINCDSAEFDFICKNFSEDNYINASITHEGRTWDSVRMRIRGDDSRAFPKKSLKFKFDNEPFSNGRTTLNLNADWLDKTLIHQWLSSKIFNDLGYPCFKASYSKVYLNGKFHGIFINVENVDEEFIASRGMNPNNNLYKASNDGACLSRYDFEKDFWEKKTGQAGNFDDLKELIKVLNDTPDNSYKDSLVKYFDYDKLMDILAINFLIQNRSTYYHNYFMFHDLATGKWTMLPWDLDKSCAHYSYWMFYGEWGYSHTHANPIIERALAVDEVFGDLRKKLTNISQKYYNEKTLLPIIDTLDRSLEPVIFEDTSQELGSVEEWKTRLERDRDHIRNCYNTVIKLFDTNPKVFHIEPKDSPELGKKIRFTWQRSHSPKNLPLFYKLSISKEWDHDKPGAYQISGIRDTTWVIDTLLPEGDYYYTVVAYDSLSFQSGYDHLNTMKVARGTIIPCTIDEKLLLTKEESPYIIDCDIAIGEKGELIAGPGVEIIFMDTVKFSSKGKISFEGTAEEAVKLYAKDDISKAIVADLLPGSIISLTHCIIGNINFVAYGTDISFLRSEFTISDQSVYSASILNALDSKVIVDSSEFKGNGKGEGLIISHSEVTVSNCKFSNISDALEYIWVTGGKILNNRIDNSNDDGIDFNNGTDCLVENNIINNAFDKGISVGNVGNGQSSNIMIRHNVISGCSDGIGMKDSAHVLIENNTFHNNKTGVYCFEKTPGAGGAVALVKNCIFSGSTELNYFADSVSSIDISYSLANNELMPGTGNIKGDPQFIDPLNSNFNLRQSSPCIDSGDPDTNPDPDGSRADIGAYYYNQSIPNIIINEISYNQPADFDSGDWVEFYNNSSNDANLSGWSFMDESDSHVFSFSGEANIKAGQYIVLVEDEAKFRARFPEVQNIIAGMNFGFSGSGELLRLYYKDGRLADSVRYDDTEPWPSEADGHGPSIELIGPAYDNGKGENWRASLENGSPGKINDAYVLVDESPTPSGELQVDVFPIPCSDKIYFRTRKQQLQIIELNIYDFMGKPAYTVNTGKNLNGSTEVSTSQLADGIYYWQMKTTSGFITGTFIKVR